MALSRKNPGNPLTSADWNEVAFRFQFTVPIPDGEVIGTGATLKIAHFRIPTPSGFSSKKAILTRLAVGLFSSNINVIIRANSESANEYSASGLASGTEPYHTLTTGAVPTEMNLEVFIENIHTSDVTLSYPTGTLWLEIGFSDG